MKRTLIIAALMLAGCQGEYSDIDVRDKNGGCMNVERFGNGEKRIVSKFESQCRAPPLKAQITGSARRHTV